MSQNPLKLSLVGTSKLPRCSHHDTQGGGGSSGVQLHYELTVRERVAHPCLVLVSKPFEVLQVWSHARAYAPDPLDVRRGGGGGGGRPPAVRRRRAGGVCVFPG